MRPATERVQVPGPAADPLRDDPVYQPEHRPRGRGLRLGDRRVATRLVLLVLIPGAVAGLLAGLRLHDAMTEAAVYTRIERLATLSDRTAGFVQELEDERDLTVEYLSLPRRKRPAALTALNEQVRDTDRAAAAVRATLGSVHDGDYSEQAGSRLRDLRYRLDTLGTMRKQSGQESKSVTLTLDVYSQLVGSLVDLDDLVAQGSPDAVLAEDARAFAALARAKDFASQERARLNITILAGRFATPSEREELQSLHAQRESQIALFGETASTAQRRRYEDVVTGADIGQTELMYQQAMIRSGTSPNLSVAPLRPRDAVQWVKASSTRLEQMRTAERSVIQSLVDRSRGLKHDAWQAAITDGALLLAGLVLAALATLAVARSLVRPLRRLQVGALEVADNRLPSLVDRLRDPGAASGGIEVEPIDVHTADEIGQVARAFDEVHREAVRLAADEAVLRGNINAMFVNLSRRSQTLIEQQLQLIEELEQGERDEDQLAHLFRLDHLATRMRRNCENLLVLGGQDQVRRRTRPVPLIDVVRASLSEVEQYERVALTVRTDMTVAGAAVNDLVHLLAELVDNATEFSDRRTKVTISGQQLSGGGAMLQITDNGVGMADDELDEANRRLASPPVIDFSAARRMGLFVVGRLAVRHGIRVELRAAQGGGTTAFVLLPASVIAAAEPGGPRGYGTGAGLPEAEPALLGAAGTASAGTGGLPALGPRPAARDSGQFPATGPFASLAGDSGRFPAGPEDAGRRSTGRADTGQFPAVPGDTGQFPALPGNTFSAMPGTTGQFPAQRGDTGSFPAVSGDTGQFPAQRGDTGSFDTGRFPAQRGDTGQFPAARDTGRFPSAPGETGSLPSLETAPLPVVGDGTGPRSEPSGERRPASDLPVRTPGARLPGRDRQSAPGEDLFRPAGTTDAPEPQTRPFTWDSGPLQTFPDEGPERPRRPEARPEPAEPAPPAPPGPPAHRSPIFDAMRSEWFLSRPEAPRDDPARGWDSPADAGFRAAESAASPAGSGRTAAGLPKRVPGRNRVPGAVARPGAPDPGAPPAPPEREHGVSAAAVRERFAGLQRGVRKGRAETRGAGAEGDNDVPSHHDGETGGSR
ncbi:sensory histidine kinase CreC [Actinomadura rubteroloni]|uniref:histidine kinase n=1 Tax=Actinomadura rubteroloni TaxID=1926885 RepID=A0A2P4UDG5_9ACTN|nr:nitrate- and nitrite sensing domain-containing protein [Actinomadura rubteroloni]POM23071.1 sensory histidine kinase CreC [Actinomadura rubteroloni]